jgi:hypothetical protein
MLPVWFVLGGTKRSGIVAFLARCPTPFLAGSPFVLPKAKPPPRADAPARRDDGIFEGHRDTSGVRFDSRKATV